MKSNYKLNITVFFISYFLGIVLFNKPNISREIASEPITNVLKYDRTYLALNTDKVNISGFGHVQGHDGKYIQRLFGEIIQKAHIYAAKDFYFPEKSIFLYYNTFLINSLLVPFHESSLMHITRRSTDHCYLANDFVDRDFHQEKSSSDFLDKLLDASENDPEIMKKKELLSNSNNKVLELWRKRSKGNGKSIIYYVDKGFDQLFNFTTITHDFFPACHKIKSPDMYQLFFSGNYLDVGLYQINTEAHDEMISDHRIFNTLDTINYGIGYLYYGEKKNGGFRVIVRNPENYHCLDKNIRSIEYFKRIARGNWAGQFNSGRTSLTCRFKDSDHSFSSNDLGFYKSMNTLLLEKGKKVKENIWLDFLPEDSVERKAYLELVNNFKNRVNNREYLDQVLQTDYSQVSLIDDPELITSAERSHDDRIINRVSRDTDHHQYVYEDGMYVQNCQVPKKLFKISLNRPILTSDRVFGSKGDFIGPGYADVVEYTQEEDGREWFAFFDKEDCKRKWIDITGKHKLFVTVETYDD